MLSGSFTTRFSHYSRCRRGATMVEFGIAAAIFLLLLIGILQFGFIYYYNGTINNAAREGARYGSVHPEKNDPAQPDSIQAVVRKRAGGIAANNLTITVEYPPDGVIAADHQIKVTVSYPVVSFMPGLRSFTVERSSTMRIEPMFK